MSAENGQAAKRELTSSDIAKVLKRRHKSSLAIEELRLGSGWGNNCERKIDLWCLDTAPSSGNRAVAYEIKVSRSDFTRDMRDATKQRGALLFSDQFFFAAPKGILKPEDIPVWAGLVEIEPEVDLADHNNYWYGGNVIVPAPLRSKGRPSWPLVVSLLRRKNQIEGEP